MTESTDRAGPRDASRTAALERYALPGAPSGRELDDVVRIAARLCGTPIALVTILDKDRQHFKARLGFAAEEAPLETEFCPRVAEVGHPLAIADTMADPATASNPATRAGIRFYAGVPLTTADGETFGALCVLDHVPHAVEDDLLPMLEALARQVMTYFELRATLERERASEARSRQILDGALDYAIIATDLAGRVTLWTEGASRILGWSEGEMLGRSIDGIFTPEDVEAGRPREEMRAALSGEGTPDERWHRRNNGDRFWASGEMRAIKAEDAAIVGFVKVLRDRTRRRVDEELRRETDARLRAAIDIAQLGTFQWDAVNNIAELDPRSRDILDLPQEGPLSAEDVFARIDPAEVERVDRESQAALRQRRRAEIGYPIVRHDGTRREILSIGDPILDGDGRTIGLFGVLADITERKRANDALRETTQTLEKRVEERTRALTDSEARASAYFDLSPEYLMLVRVRADGAVLFEDINPAAEKVFGRGRDDLAGVATGAILSPESSRDVEHYARACAASGQTLTYTATRRYTVGLPTVVDTVVAPLNRTGPDSLVLFSGRDITEQSRVEEQLRQSQKLEAVGQLTGGVAHDFNNLLTIIRSSVDLLRRPSLSEERRERYLAVVSDTVDRASKLTGQLLAFARRQALKPEVFDVGAKLGGIADMLDTLTGARIHVTLEVPDRACLVCADVSQFETALVNMAVNARDAMDGEGTLALRISAASALPSIRGHAGSSEAFVVVTMTDSGAGIAPDALTRIFEPFYTTKEIGKGTGLGLSQVFGFVKQSGGDVDVTSEVGRGTTFTLYLPETQTPAEPERGGTEDPKATGDGHRVLVVEDNIGVGEFCTQMLEDLGFRTDWATNAEEALARIGESGGGFDVVFSDVVMPGMGGVALARDLRTRLPDLPVVLASGYSHVLAQEVDHGFEVLHKPYSAEQLSRVLRQAVARRGSFRIGRSDPPASTASGSGGEGPPARVRFRASRRPRASEETLLVEETLEPRGLGEAGGRRPATAAGSAPRRPSGTGRRPRPMRQTIEDSPVTPGSALVRAPGDAAGCGNTVRRGAEEGRARPQSIVSLRRPSDSKPSRPTRRSGPATRPTTATAAGADVARAATPAFASAPPALGTNATDAFAARARTSRTARTSAAASRRVAGRAGGQDAHRCEDRKHSAAERHSEQFFAHTNVLTSTWRYQRADPRRALDRVDDPDR